jgi:hypothetical protein
VEGYAATVPDGRTVNTVVVGEDEDDPRARVFAILDRSRMGFDLKGTALEAIRRSRSPGEAVVALQALEVPPGVLGALSEVLLARG